MSAAHRRAKAIARREYAARVTSTYAPAPLIRWWGDSAIFGDPPVADFQLDADGRITALTPRGRAAVGFATPEQMRAVDATVARYSLAHPSRKGTPDAPPWRADIYRRGSTLR